MRRTTLKRALWRLLLTVACGLPLGWTELAPGQASPAPDREVAVTIDDLPAMSSGDLTTAEITELNRRLLATLVKEKVPAVGFVIEGSLYEQPGGVDARIAVLRSWADQGFELGNHTWSHESLNHMSLEDWKTDVLQGEVVTRLILAEHKMTPRFFRHPYLDAGPDLLTRRQSEAFLTEHGYRVAPVTIDAFDWFFGDLYQDARKHHDSALQQRVVAAWLAYTGEVFAYEEQTSRDLLGYEPKQVLLLHDSWLEADHLDELLALIRRRGYRFVTLPEALADPAYAQPDDYVSDVGASWIEHWAVTRGHFNPGLVKPGIPAWAQHKHDALDRQENETP